MWILLTFLQISLPYHPFTCNTWIKLFSSSILNGGRKYLYSSSVICSKFPQCSYLFPPQSLTFFWEPTSSHGNNSLFFFLKYFNFIFRKPPFLHKHPPQHSQLLRFTRGVTPRPVSWPPSKVSNLTWTHVFLDRGLVHMDFYCEAFFCGTRCRFFTGRV